MDLVDIFIKFLVDDFDMIENLLVLKCVFFEDIVLVKGSLYCLIKKFVFILILHVQGLIT